MAQSFEQKICSILVAKKVITKDEAIALQTDFKDRSKETFDDFLLSEGLVSRRDLLDALAQYYQVPSFDVVGHFFNHNLLLEFPQDVLVRYGIVPLERDGEVLVIVASEPDNEEILPELAEYVSDEIEFYVGIRKDIVEAVMDYYQNPPFSIDQNHIENEGDDDSQDFGEEEGFEDVFEPPLAEQEEE